MTLLARAFVLGFSGLRGHAWAWLAKLGAHSGHETCFNRCGASIRFGPEGTWVMAEGRRPWGKVRRLPSGRYQASYIIGSVRGVEPGIRYTALQTFDAKGDAWGWLDRERRLIDRGDWTPPIDRFHAAEEERRLDAQRELRAAFWRRTDDFHEGGVFGSGIDYAIAELTDWHAAPVHERLWQVTPTGGRSPPIWR